MQYVWRYFYIYFSLPFREFRVFNGVKKKRNNVSGREKRPLELIEDERMTKRFGYIIFPPSINVFGI